MTKDVVTSIRIDEETWKKAKIRAIEKGVTLKQLMEQLIKEELNKKRKNEPLLETRE